MSIADFFESAVESAKDFLSDAAEVAQVAVGQDPKVREAADHMRKGKSPDEVVEIFRKQGYSKIRAQEIVRQAGGGMKPASDRKKSPATTQSTATRSYSEFAQEKEKTAQAEGGPPGVAGGGYRTRAKNIINRYGPKMPQGRSVLSAPPEAWRGGWDENGLKTLGEKLWKAGYLPSDAKRLLDQYGPLRYLDEIEVALAEMIEDASRVGKNSGEFLDDLASKGRRGPLFTAPAFRPTPEEEVQSGFRTAFERYTGSTGTDEERGAMAGQFRSSERSEYAGTVADARAQAEGGAGGMTIDTAPGPQAFAEDRLLDSEEAKVWHMASLMMDALERMSAGRL